MYKVGKAGAFYHKWKCRTAALGKNQRGATLLEFAIVSVPFVAIIFAILQIMLTLFSQQIVETATEKATRQLLTGAAQKSGMTRDQFRTLVCSELPTFMPCEQLMIDVRTVDSFADADLSMPALTYDTNGNPSNVWQYAPGNTGQIVISRVMYFSSVLRGPLGFDISNMSKNRRLITATAVFQVEPYS